MDFCSGTYPQVQNKNARKLQKDAGIRAFLGMISNAAGKKEVRR